MTITVSKLVDGCHYGATQRFSFPRPVVKKGAAVVSRMSGTVMPENPEELARLVESVALRRDVAAFEVLFRHYGPKVKTYMLRQTRNQQLAEELMQETMMAVWNKAGLFDAARGNASAWIFTIARNLFISAYRKQNRPEFDPNDPAFVPANVEPAEAVLQEQQEAETLRAALDELPEEQRQLVSRSFFADVPHSTLAAEYGLPLGTVKSRIRMALAKLRKSMESGR